MSGCSEIALLIQQIHTAMSLYDTTAIYAVLPYNKEEMSRSVQAGLSYNFICCFLYVRHLFSLHFVLSLLLEYVTSDETYFLI